MSSSSHGDSAAVEGRATFEVHCAACHGPSGSGGYLGPGLRPPPIAGADVAKIVHHVRDGEKAMPVFSAAVLPDPALNDLALYVHETLGRRHDEPAHLGPRVLDPFLVGVITWVALALLTYCLAVTFGGGRG